MVGSYPTNQLIERGPLPRRSLQRACFPWLTEEPGACGISHPFGQLCPIEGYVTHALLSRLPLTETPKDPCPFDLHVLGTPPAFTLSQDQTLHHDCDVAFDPFGTPCISFSRSGVSRNQQVLRLSLTDQSSLPTEVVISTPRTTVPCFSFSSFVSSGTLVPQTHSSVRCPHPHTHTSVHLRACGQPNRQAALLHSALVQVPRRTTPRSTRTNYLACAVSWTGGMDARA